MIKIATKKDFDKITSNDPKILAIKAVIKERFDDVLDNIEETESIESIGPFYLIEKPEDFSDDSMHDIGLSESILKTVYEATSQYDVYFLKNPLIQLYDTTILFNNDYGVNIFFTRENSPESVYDYLTDEMDISVKYDFDLKIGEVKRYE